MSASSLYLKAPTPKEPTRSNQDKSTMYVHNHGMLANDAMKTWQFSALWWVFFVNITCGIGLLSLASPMAQETIGMTPATAYSSRYYWHFSMVVVALHGPLSLISLGEHKLIYYSLSWKSLPSIYCPKPIVH